jgi:gamma-glutamylcyclotransferase (GGCT)/AIG2-like uncharacterized protein YtfP
VPARYVPRMDRRALDEVVARLDELTADPAGGMLVGWQALGRIVTDDPAVGPPVTVADCTDAVDRILGRPGDRLVAYGTLRPGEPNHHLLAGLGTWQAARVRGRLGGWNGYPVLTPAPAGGPELGVMLLTSPRLTDVLPGLDDFEGPAYRRSWVVAEIGTPHGAQRGALVARCYIGSEVR